jgi:hypothetical protein
MFQDGKKEKTEKTYLKVRKDKKDKTRRYGKGVGSMDSMGGMAGTGSASSGMGEDFMGVCVVFIVLIVLMFLSSPDVRAFFEAGGGYGGGKRGKESALTKKEKVLLTANRTEELKKNLEGVAKTPLTDEALSLLKVVEQSSITDFIQKLDLATATKLEDYVGSNMCERSIPKITTHLTRDISNFCSTIDELMKIREVMESAVVSKFTQEFFTEKSLYDYEGFLSLLKFRRKFLEEKEKEKGKDAPAVEMET